MRRRDFLRSSVITATGLLVWPSLSRAGEGNDAPDERGFLHPPAGFRPQVFWMWLNGNISAEGITKDLESMAAMGIGGAILFNVEAAAPRGPVDMGSQTWRNMVLHTLREAERLGLEITLHHSAGFSGTGGMFVEPHQAMQQIVWRSVPATPRQQQYQLPQPFTKLGYYRDIAVLAFPEAPAPPVTSFSRNGQRENGEILQNQNPESAIRFESTDVLEFGFAEESEFRSVTCWRRPEPPADVYNGPPDNPPTFRLESSTDGEHFSPVCSITMPQLRKMNAPGAAVFPSVKAKFFRLRTNTSTWLSGLEWHTHAGVQNWPGKANFYQHVPANTKNPETAAGIDPDTIIDLSQHLQPDSSLRWSPPSGNWTVLRIGFTPTGQLGASQPDAATGLVLDTFSRAALRDWLTKMDDYLFSSLQNMPAFRGIEIDSWEVGVQNWTARMPDDFLAQRRYPLLKWLPALTGRIVKDADATNAFLSDFRRTQATLVATEYYGGFKDFCVSKGWHLWGEPYGDGMFDSLQIAAPLDVPMGEFWTRYAPGSMNTIAVALSAGHVMGKRVIGAEAFTGLPETSRWTDYPYSLKIQGDHFMAMGINRLVFHTMVHQPFAHGAPGFSMAHFGSHFDRTNTWSPFAYGWTKYLSRTQYMLQQGHYAADFVFFKGEEPSATIPDIDHVSPNRPTGYGADVMGPDALFSDIRIENNRIIFPGGMTYKVMVMIQLNRVSLPVLERLKILVEAGMWLAVNEKPEAPPGLGGDVAALRTAADDLWGDLDGKTVTERKLGKGMVFRGKLLADIIGLPADFSYTAVRSDAAIRFTHRQTDEMDIYFVSNRLRRHERIKAEFRVKGRQPELWNAEDGSVADAVMFEETEHGIRLPMGFTPGGSWLVVFRKPIRVKGATVLKMDGMVLTNTSADTAPGLRQFASVRNTFSIEIWIRPDTIAMPGKGYVVFPAEGGDIGGSKCACVGIAAGQQMVRVCERIKGAAYFAKDVLTVQQPISGWTHVVVVYQNGAPSIYLNGKLAGQAPASGNSVIPGLGTKPTGELYSSVFEGNATDPKLYREALGAKKIAALFAAKLPPPALPEIIRLNRQQNRLTALVWRNGLYALDGREIVVKDKCSVLPVKGAWRVQFERGRGAPAEIQLPELTSLHRHKDFNVRHFSGVATYEKRIGIPASILQKGKRVFLDLGRVEVVAQVEVNGKDAGLCWKEPFRLDVTPLLIVGENRLRIRVATLWPNRQVGDAHLPKENTFNSANYMTVLPAWWTGNAENPGRRVTISTWDNYLPGDPLLESGLVGPVRMLVAWEWEG
ncbi:glycosyl hydrolase [Chitinophaga caseinilytica]|uniref:Glycosyl hydrolase n=1 Tax=Chitinophaga caseinilytica TaxID=2267521 RepID=A0ABZ2YZT0_9BACT